MNQWTLFAFSGVIVAVTSAYGLFTARELIRRIIAANLAGSGVFLVLVALARRAPGGLPDPVPRALVLTGIVISISATACALALAQRLSRLERGDESAPLDKPDEARQREMDAE